MKINITFLFLFWNAYFCIGQEIFTSTDDLHKCDTKSYVYNIVKELLVSKFISIDSEINKALKLMQEKNSGFSVMNMLSNLEQRVSFMENEFRNLKENISSKGKYEKERMQDFKQNIDQSIKEMKTSIFMALQEENVQLNESIIQLDTKIVNFTARTLKSLQYRINESDAKVAEMKQDLSRAEDNIGIVLKENLEKVRQALDVNMKYMKEVSTNVTRTAADMNQRLRKTVEENISLSISNISGIIKTTNERMDDINSIYNSTMVSLEQKVNDLRKQTKKLAGDINNTDMYIIMLKRNESMETKALQNQINEIFFNMSLLEASMRKEHNEKGRRVAKNISDTVETKFMFLNNSFTNDTKSIKKSIQEVAHNVYSTEKTLENVFTEKIKLLTRNMSFKVKKFKNKVFSYLEKQHLKINETISRIFNHLSDLDNSTEEQLNKTMAKTFGIEVDMKGFQQHFQSFKQLQNQRDSNISLCLSKVQQISNNMSDVENSFQRVLDVENNFTAVTRKLDRFTLKVDQVSGNLSNMLIKIQNFENLHTRQNTRLVSVESSQRNASVAISDMKNALNAGYAAIGIIRLANGGRTYGRIEIFYDGLWGTVCDDHWDNNDAYVACRMLGLKGGTAKSSATYGKGTGSIWLDDLHCDGSEYSLFACRHLPVGSHNCGHSEDAGVVCS